MATFAQLREIGETLARFASIREKAERPQDRIVVQANGRLLKLVAGDFEKTCVATLGEHLDDGRAVVSSRLLLGAIKTLKAKGEAEFIFKPEGVTLRTSFGSEIEMPNMDGHFKFLRPAPSDGVNAAYFDENYLDNASKYLTPCIGSFSPLNQVYGKSHENNFRMFASDDRIGANIGSILSKGEWDVHFPGGLWPALRGISDIGSIALTERIGMQAPQVVIRSGNYVIASVIWPNYPKLPFVAEHEYTATVSGIRKVLIDTFKSLAGGQDYSRVVMDVRDDSFEIRGAGLESVRPNVAFTGKGKIPVNATFMAKVLNTVDGTNVTIQFSDAPSLVRVVGDKNPWPIRVAPMK